MIIAATLSLTFALLARRLGIGRDQLRALSRDPRWIGAALLCAAVLIAALRWLAFPAG